MTFIHEFTSIREGVTIGKNVIIGPFNVIEEGATIGNNVTIQPHCIIGRNFIIGDNVFIGPNFTCPNNSYIPEGEHGTSKNKRPDVEKIMKIGKGTRIGARCSVAPGVIIGKDCFIKMNCIIFCDIPDGTTIGKNTVWDVSERDNF